MPVTKKSEKMRIYQLEQEVKRLRKDLKEALQWIDARQRELDYQAEMNADRAWG